MNKGFCIIAILLTTTHNLSGMERELKAKKEVSNKSAQAAQQSKAPQFPLSPYVIMLSRFRVQAHAIYAKQDSFKQALKKQTPRSKKQDLDKLAEENAAQLMVEKYKTLYATEFPHDPLLNNSVTFHEKAAEQTTIFIADQKEQEGCCCCIC